MTQRKKIRRGWLIAGSCILLLMLAVQLFISFYFNPLIRQRLNELVANGSDSLYRIELGEVNASFWTRSVKVKHVYIHVDSARYQMLEKQRRLPPLTFELGLKSGKVRGFALIPFLFKRQIELGDIVSEDAMVNLYRHFKTRDSLQVSDEPIWKQIQPDIKGIKVGDIVLDNLALSYQHADSAKAFHFKFEKCQAAFHDIQVDSLAGADPERMLFTRDIGLLLRNIRLQTADSLYNYEAQQVVYSSKSRSLGVQQFRLYPAVDKAVFYRKLGHQKEMYNVMLPSVTAVNFVLPALIRDNDMRIDTVSLVNPELHTYNDRTFTSIMENKMGNYPQQTIQKMPFGVYIKTIVLANGLVTHTERNAQTRMEGKMEFSKINGALYHISNRAQDIAQRPDMEADLHAVFMQKCNLHALFHIPLASTTGEFKVEADATGLDAAQLNGLTVPLAQVELESFTMHKLHFEAWGNEQVMYGNLDMSYNDLQVKVKQKHEQKLKDKPLLSFVMNSLAVMPENPMKGEVRRGRRAVVKRDPDRAYFNQLWMAMFWSARQIILRDYAKNIPLQRK